MNVVAVKPGNIVEMALDEGSLDMFVQALQSTGLSEELAEEGPFTVFAPSDGAFRQLSPDSLNDLMSSPDELKTVLAYHIAQGKIMASQVDKSHKVKTLLGEEASIDPSSIIVADIEATNGILHVINTVLMPK